MYEDIILVLRDGWGDPQFKYWVQKHFTLVKNGDLHVVYNKGKVSCPVVTYEELYTKLYECHNRVKDVNFSSRQNFAKSSATKQILSIDYLSRIQISLIDMTSRPSGKFKWILHTK
ncbi:unnamed protein product, partial [Rotaria magnacalcarata]